MREINLLHSLPRPTRNLTERRHAKTAESVAIARRYGFEYFDGPRELGYGGYKYDGRWRSVARTLIEEYNLAPGMKVLDVGCAKGFLVKDLLLECPGLEVFGVDISQYALFNCEQEVIGRLHLGSADQLNFPDSSFELVISINTIHNLTKDRASVALAEIQRVSSRYSYVVVDSYRTPAEKEIFESWVLTARYHDFPSGWKDLFKESGYHGDYSWTIIQHEVER